MWFNGQRSLLIGIGGPLPGPRFHKGRRVPQHVYDPRGPSGRIRLISDAEVWAVGGRRPEVWEEAVQRGEEGSLARALAKSPGVLVASALLLAAAEAPEARLCGACPDRDGDRLAQAMLDWMRAWRRRQYGPPYPEEGEEDKCRRCGGAALSDRGPAESPEECPGRAMEEVAEGPTPRDSGCLEVGLLPGAGLAGVDSPPVWGTCVLCDGKGIAGTLCTRCEDSGMIYEALSQTSESSVSVALEEKAP